MAYDEVLAERIRSIVGGTRGLTEKKIEKKMFGGLCFAVDGYMACGVQRSDLVVRVGPDAFERALARKHTRPMDLTGKPMTGYKRNSDLERWVTQGVSFVRTLPPKKQKRSRVRTR